MRTIRTYHGPDRPDKRLLLAEELPPPSVAIRAHCMECLGVSCRQAGRLPELRQLNGG